jgi:hypothetical protein
VEQGDEAKQQESSLDDIIQNKRLAALGNSVHFVFMPVTCEGGGDIKP